MSDRVPGLGAVVLCGGESKRMGRPKAWLPFGGEALLQRVVRRVAEVAAPIVVVAAPGQDLPELPAGARVVVDRVAGRGPLQGIATGLEALGGAAEAAFASSTDVPFLQPAMIRRLAALHRGHDVAVPSVGGRHHPLCAIYAAGVLPEIEALLAADRLRPFFLFERVRTVVADEGMLLADPALRAADGELRSLRNVNTPEEYEAALREEGLAGGADGSGPT